MDDVHGSLLSLQELDGEIAEMEARLAEFEPRLESVDAPVHELEREWEAGRARLAALQEQADRLKRASSERRALLQRSEQRLMQVRTPREEAAIQTELSLLRTAIEADEAEAEQLGDQILRTELKQDELERRLGEVRAAVGPEREALLRARSEVEDELAVLRDRRSNHVLRMDPEAYRLYERVRSGRTRVVITRLGPDGSCGHCFGWIRLQQRSEIERGGTLHPGEAARLR